MGHLPLETLLEKRAEIERRLRVGNRFRHYKTGHIYRIHSLALREENDTFSVNYQDEDSGLIFNRKVDAFLGQVKGKSDKKVDRFERVKEGE